MVKNNLAKFEEEFEDIIENKEKIKWCTVSLLDVIEHGKRLEASVFDIETNKAVEIINNGKWKPKKLISKEKDSFVKQAYYGARLKRNYINKYRDDAIGFIGSAEMLEINPKPVKFMSENDEKINDLRVKENTILISRSGTVGKIAFVNETLSKLLVSEHAIRLECNEYPGYVYAYLKSDVGQVMINSKKYGAVIQEIEPEHLAEILIPNADRTIKIKIDRMIKKAYKLLDESNKLIKNAEDTLIDELKLPKLKDIMHEDNIEIFNVKLSNINKRLDASYHLPLVEIINKCLIKNSKEVLRLRDKRLTKRIVLAGVFKRTYVEKNEGIPFLGGKEITQFAPQIEKFLSKSKHEKRYEKELKVKENMILVTDRGTIGTIAMVPKNFENWAVSQNVLKVEANNIDIAGYLYIFLNTEYGNALIKRETYGSVVDMIDDKSLGNINIPILKDEKRQIDINNMALEANKLRYEAYCLEQEALEIMNKEVIFAK